jgi:fructosamine-3-kinase
VTGSSPAIAAVRKLLGEATRVQPLQASGFATTLRVQRGGEVFFVKALPAAEGERLRAEAEGLRALAATATIRVPRVVDCADADGWTLLALEWLEFAAPDAQFGTRFGARLAALHAASAPIAGYGWPRAKWLGGTRQEAATTAGAGTNDWIEFFRDRRLRALAQRLARERYARLLEAVEAALAAMPRLFDDYAPRPSLIHGDLWSGNWGMLADGTPVIFDPAVSVSDAEAELAMMELFGAPPAGFFAAYRAHGRWHDGYARRRPLYQLYHLLNHVLLFGESYAGAALACARAAAAAARL